MKEAIKRWVSERTRSISSTLQMADMDGEFDEALGTIIEECMAEQLNDVQAQAVTDLITECSYSTQVNGIATSIIDVDSAISYADRLGEG